MIFFQQQMRISGMLNDFGKLHDSYHPVCLANHWNMPPGATHQYFYCSPLTQQTGIHPGSREVRTGSDKLQADRQIQIAGHQHGKTAQLQIRAVQPEPGRLLESYSVCTIAG
jgi:hypothetical protein